MSQPSWDRVEAIFAAALELSAEQRVQYVAQECNGDQALYDEVLSLLQADEDAGDWLDSTRLTAVLQATTQDWAVPELEPGTMVGPYRIEQMLGTGGMSVVYRAFDTRLERTVALKLLTRIQDMGADSREQLLAEARAASRIEHPNVCTVYDIGTAQSGQTYVAMAFYEGETLRARLDRGALSPQEALRLVELLADGLAAVHRVGVLHRDVKPANVVLDSSSTPRLIDFGIAMAVRVESEIDHRGTGTLAYMAPEQLQAKPLDARSDLWSLGVVLYECLTGQKPFQATEQTETIDRVLNHEPQSIDEALTSIPADAARELASLVTAALQKQPSMRISSAEDFAARARALRVELLSLDVSTKYDVDQPEAHNEAERAWFFIPNRYLVATAGAAVVLALWWYGGFLVPVETADVSSPQSQQAASLDEQYRGALALLHSLNTKALLEAKQRFEQLVELAPADARAYAGLCDAVLVLNEFGAVDESEILYNLSLARGAIDKALALEPNSAAVQASLGQLEEFDGLASAETAFERAIALDPNYALARIWYARSLRFQQRLGDALTQLESALAVEPRSFLAHYELAAVYREMGRKRDALEQLRIAADIDPSYAKTFFEAGRLSHDLGRLQAAQDWYAGGLKFSPRDQAAQVELARVFLDAGDVDRAAVTAEEALEDNPQAELVFGALSDIAIARGDFAGNLALVQQALQSNSDSRALLWRAGFAELLVGNWAASERYYDDANWAQGMDGFVNSDRDVLESIFHKINLAYVHFMLNQAERATPLLAEQRAALRRLSERNPHIYGFAYVEALQYAVASDNESAIQALYGAIDTGWRSGWRLRHHPGFNKLREAKMLDDVFARLE